MLKLAAVWYLIITSVESGMIAVPQQSQQQCVTNARWFNELPRYKAGYYALCVPGVMRSVEEQ